MEKEEGTVALQAQIGTMFNPRSVAIIGASRTIGKWGFTFTLHLIRGGYRGDIYPINPAGGEIMGLKVHRNLGEIPSPVDLAFILLPPEKVADTITECGALGIPACVVITAGFAELGKQGKALEADIVAAARSANVAMIGPNCAGIISTEPASLYCMMQPVFPPSGHIAVVSQSGNIAGSMQFMLWKQDIGVSRCVSVGNQALVKTEDILEFLIDDDLTRVVVAYIEGIDDGDRFMDVARRLTGKKPLIVIKGGTSDRGVSAARSHTGAIAGSDTVFDAMCRQCGIIRVADVEDLIDTAVAFLSQPIPRGDRVGIVANGGGWAVLTADACMEAGLNVAPLPEKTLRRLDERLPAWWNRQNPVDMVAGMSRGAFFKAVEIMAQCDEIDGVITLGFGYGQANVAAIESAPDKDTPDYVSYIEATRNSDLRGMQFLLDTIATYRKPTLLASEYIVGADRDCNEAVLELRRKNVLIYPSSRRPAQVMARLVRYGRYRRKTDS